MTIKKTIRTGSISWGTMREEDLIPRFEAVLDEVGYGYDRPEAARKLAEGEELTDKEWEELSCYLNEDLFDGLNAIAPDGHYFGSHPGDGADYGFWECDEDGEAVEDEEP